MPPAADDEGFVNNSRKKAIVDNLLASVSGITSVPNCNSPEKPACLLS